MVEEKGSLEPYREAWDTLASAQGRPYCAPAWMLAWWDAAARGDARLRVVLVFEGEQLVGVGPFFAQVWPLGIVEMRLLSAGFAHRIGPLALPGREREVAGVLASTLAAMTPQPSSVVFEGVDLDDGWPGLIADAWPSRRRPQVRTDVVMPGSMIHLDASFERWLERRQRRFRKEMRRTSRRLEEAGARSSVSSEPDSIDVLMRLHHERWRERGGSSVGADARTVLVGAARELAGAGRLAVALLEGPDGPIAAELIVTAGHGAAFWSGGFDPAWSQHAPGTQSILAALSALAERGVREADLGGGHADYQRRLSDSTQPVVWQTVFPLGARYPLIRLWLVPKHSYMRLRSLARRLPPRQRERLRALWHRVRGAPGSRP